MRAVEEEAVSKPAAARGTAMERQAIRQAVTTPSTRHVSAMFACRAENGMKAENAVGIGSSAQNVGRSRLQPVREVYRTAERASETPNGRVA